MIWLKTGIAYDGHSQFCIFKILRLSQQIATVEVL